MESFLIVEYIGIISASISGFLFAVRRACDLLGIFIAAFLTALGGGILRDVLVGRELYSFTHYMPVSLVLGVVLLSAVFGLHKAKRKGLDKSFIFIVTDAIDVVSFSIVGAVVALAFGLNVFGVVLIAFVNGVGGGILRDVLLNEIPWLLNTGFYGTVSLLVGLIYFGFYHLGFDGIITMFALCAFGVILRLIAYYRNWQLPKINYEN